MNFLLATLPPTLEYIFAFVLTGHMIILYEPPSSNSRNPEGFLVNDFSYFYNFDFAVSSIILGGSSSATYIYALAFVPEPSALILLSLGLAGLCGARRRKPESALSPTIPV